MFVAIFIIALVVAIMLHELGHFLAARAFGMKAERFFLGFGPTLWSTHRGETEYGVKAIPAGGFVKITGMHSFEPVAEADRPRAFFAKPAWQRLIVLVAGSATHFVIAAVLLFAAMALFPLPQGFFEGGVPGNSVAFVAEDTPAEAAGLRPGDVIVAVDGVATSDFEEVRRLVEVRGGQVVPIVVERDGEQVTLTAELAATTPDGEPKGFLGFVPGIAEQQRTVGEALVGVFAGEYSVPRFTAESIGGLIRAFSPESLMAWLGQVEPEAERTGEGIISLVGAGQAVNALGQAGQISMILLILAQLNIVLGTLNMLPLPPLDGGHVAVLLIERAVNAVRVRRGRPADWELNPAVVTPVALAVLLFFITLSFIALYIDIVNPVTEIVE